MVKDKTKIASHILIFWTIIKIQGLGIHSENEVENCESQIGVRKHHLQKQEDRHIWVHRECGTHKTYASPN